MNIGIVTTWFERGAAYVSRQFEDVLSKKHNVFIYARGGEKYAIGDTVWDKSNVTWGKRIHSPFVATYIDKKDFIKWIKRKKIELIIFNEQHWFQPIIWCKELGVKTVAYIDYYTEKTIPLFRAYDALICNTYRHKEAFKSHSRAIYVPWGTDIETFRPTNIDLVNEGVITFFHSSGVSGDRKGTDLFIKALWLLRDKPFKAVLHTQNELNPQFPELAEVIETLGKEGKLQIITKTVSAPGLYHLGDVYVYPSRLEGIGLTIAESISCGLACIVPDNGPMNEFVDESFGSKVKIEKFYSRADGYYWPKCECSVEALANAMQRYIDNPTLAKEHKMKARAYAERHLSHTSNFSSMVDLMSGIEFTPKSEETVKEIIDFDNFGLKRLQKYYIKLKLYRFLKR